MADLHPFFVHFPIALYCTAGILQLVRIKLHDISDTSILMLLGTATVMGLISAYSGDAAAIRLLENTAIQEDLALHASTANITTWAGLILTFTLVYLKLKKYQIQMVLSLVIILLILSSLTTGFFGGILVKTYGAGTEIIQNASSHSGI